VSGNYIILVVLNSYPIAKFLVKVLEGSININVSNIADLKQCAIKYSEPEQVTVYVRDYNSQPTEGAVTAEITGPECSIKVTEIARAGNGMVCVNTPRLMRRLVYTLSTSLIDSHPMPLF